MGLEDITLKGVRKIATHGDREAFYALNPTTYLHLQEHWGNIIEARLCSNERTDDDYWKFRNMAQRLEALYGENKMDSSLQNFSTQKDYFDVSQKCQVNIDPRKINYDKTKTIDDCIGFGLSSFFVGAFGGILLTLDYATLSIPETLTSTVIMVASTIGAGIIGALAPIYHRSVTSSVEYCMNNLKRLDNQVRELEKLHNSTKIYGHIDNIEVKHRELKQRITKAKEKREDAVKALTALEGGLNIRYKGPQKEVEKFLNYLIDGGPVPELLESETSLDNPERLIDDFVIDEEDVEPDELETIIIPRRKIKDPYPEKINTIIDGRYKILECIGNGKEGVVYKAERIGEDKDGLVAIKFLNNDKVFKMLSELREKTHPNIVRFLDANPIEQYIVQKYEPFNLNELLEIGEPSVNVSLKIFEQIIKALEFAHEKKGKKAWRHGDLKPLNVLLNKDLVAKICDFGLAELNPEKFKHSLSMSLRTDKNIAGTIGYLSPEQLEGKSATNKSDMYAAAKILYKMLTGTTEVEPRSIEEIREEIQDHNGVNNLLVKLLHKNPKERPSAKELVKEFEEKWTFYEPDIVLQREGEEVELFNQFTQTLEEVKSEINKNPPLVDLTPEPETTQEKIKKISNEFEALQHMIPLYIQAEKEREKKEKAEKEIIKEPEIQEPLEVTEKVCAKDPRGQNLEEFFSDDKEEYEDDENKVIFE